MIVMAVQWQTNVSLSFLNGQDGVMMVKSDGPFMIPHCLTAQRACTMLYYEGLETEVV